MTMPAIGVTARLSYEAVTAPVLALKLSELTCCCRSPSVSCRRSSSTPIVSARATPESCDDEVFGTAAGAAMNGSGALTGA